VSGPLDLPDVPLSEPVNGCTHCWLPEELAALNGPVADLSDDLVMRVAREVSDHLEPQPDLWRRLLPRVAEVLSRDPAADHDGLVLGHLHAAGWRSWPESALVLDWLTSWFDAHITTHQEQVLVGASAATGSAAPWLERLGPAADVELLCRLAHELDEGRLLSSWPPGAEAEVRAWLLQDWAVIAVDADPEASAALDRVRRRG